MTIIGLNDSNKNFEEIKILNENSFKLKNEYTTDNLQIYNINDTRGLSVDNYPLAGYTSKGLLSIYSYKTKNVKQHKGNTLYTPEQNIIANNNYSQNVFDYFDDVNLSDINNPILDERSNNLNLPELNSNYFGIKRVVSELTPFSNYIIKKNIVNSLYKSKEYLKESFHNQQFDKSIYNYHTFNFFNLQSTQKYLTQAQKDLIDNNTHKSILIYNNSKINNSNISFENNKLSINFWINPKRTSNPEKKYNPGCILHIPNLISVYLVADTTVLNSMLQPVEFKIGCIIGSDTKKLYNNQTITNKIESQYNLSLNTWHNISIILNTDDLLLYVDSNETSFKKLKTNTTIASTSILNTYSSIFSIGNRLSDETSIWETANASKLITSFFNANNFQNLHLNSFEINNDVNWQNQTLQQNLLNINTKILTKLENYTPNYSTESQALNAELYGIMIFNKDLSINILRAFSFGGDNNLATNANLIFYLPCIYLSETVQRKGYVNIGLRQNISYQSIVNPYFAHKVYGHELSVEHFVRDIAQLRLPVILGMNGKEYNELLTTTTNVYNDTDVSRKNLYNIMKLSLANDFWKYDKNVSTIMNQLTCTPLILEDTKLSSQNFQFDNLIYRNNFILPCDNGKSKIDLTNIFNLSKIQLLIANFKEHFYIKNNPHYIKIDKLFKDTSYFTYQNPQTFFKDPNILNFLLDSTNTLFTNDFVLASRSNEITRNNIHQYFLEKSKHETLGLKNLFFKCLGTNYRQITTSTNLTQIFTKTKQTIQAYKHLTCNSIFKNIDQNYTLSSTETSINAAKRIQFTDNTTLEVIAYKLFNSHFSIEGDMNETHSVMFDISNLFYSGKINPGSIEIKDVDLNGTCGSVSITLKDNRSLMYRADCLGEHATWAHVGHTFYFDGLVNILHPGLANFGENNYHFKLNGEHSLFLMEYNIPIEKGGFNISNNLTYKKLKPSNNISDLDEDQFVYITGVNLHDENLNIVAKAKFAQPLIKRVNDRYNIRLKMDF